jgi:CheY-like chemotaxis protein
MPKAGGVMSVLIVEEVGLNRSVLRKILEKNGHDVVEAEHGAAALEVLRSTPVRCVVTALHMPVLDGWELIARMRSRPESAEIPVVLLTSSAGVDEVKRAGRQGIKHFVLKPIDPDRIAAAVAAEIGASTASSC